MGVFQVNLGESHVALDHLQGRVTEKALKLQRVAAVAEKADGEGVPESMGMSVGDTSTLTKASDELEQTGAGERTTPSIGKYMFSGGGIGLAQ